MDNQAIRDFLKMQMDAAERAQGNQESGMILLLMADYLLEAVQRQPDVFTNADAGQLRKIFLRCGSAGQRLRGFYEQYHHPIQETSVRILQRIEQNTRLIEEQHQKTMQLEETIRQAEQIEDRLRKENQELLLREEELKAREEKLAALKQTIAECRHILDEITPQVLEQMEKEEQLLEKEEAGRIQKRDSLLTEIRLLRLRLEKAENETKLLTEEKEQGQARERELSEQIEEQKEQIQRLNARNKKFEADIAELSRQISEAGEAYEELRAYLGESQKLEESILAEGYFDKQSFLDKLDAVKKQGEELTNTYSLLLGDILEDAKSLYDKIRERQKRK